MPVLCYENGYDARKRVTMRWPMMMLRRGVWTVRITVPLALRSLVGKREIWRSLKTADARQQVRG